MERLTSNKKVSEMSMVELAHNGCYAKDRKARYRDYDLDIDARELTRKLIKKFVDDDDFTCDEEFDDYIHDCLQYGFEDIEGLIAVFYCNLWAMADLWERLKHYEDLEQQGLLVKLPCKVGDTVYWVNRHYGNLRVDDETIVELVFDGEDFFARMEGGKTGVFGRTVFLTQEQALKKIEGIK